MQYFGDLSEPSRFSNGASGPKHTDQQYFVACAQDEWRARPNFTLNFGLRYDYYQPLRERDNRIVKFNINTGTPRFARPATFTPVTRTVIGGGFGIFVGPGQTEDQIQPIEAARINTTLTSGALLAYRLGPCRTRCRAERPEPAEL